MKKIIKIICLILLVQFVCVDQASAIVKLSSWWRKTQSKLLTAQKYVTSAQETVNAAMTEYNRYKLLVSTGEWKNQAKQYATKRAKQEGTKFAKKEIDKFKAKQQQQNKLEKKKKEEAAAQAKLADYEASVKKEKGQKTQQIDEQLTELRAKVQAKNLSDDEHNNIVQNIATLEAQKQQILDKPLDHDETYKGMKKDVAENAEEVKKLTEEASQTALQENLEEKSATLFEETKQDEENKAIYQTETEALFLKKDEESTSENLARIKRNRGREYYNAIQNAMEVSVNGGVSSSETEEQLSEIVEKSGESEGILTLKNANINVVIESARTAARLTEALLADIRLKTTKDMLSWNNKNRLYDYDKPVTEFDFDYYELKKANLKDKAKSLYENNKDNLKGLYDNNKDKIKDLWHKI